ncbi:hypothetical protein D9M68_953870 [compost metagenome]
MIFELVDTEAQNFDAALVEFRLQLGGVAQLGGADGGEILGVAEQHGPMTFDIVIKMNGAFGAVGGEIGGGIANQNCHVLILTGPVEGPYSL